MNLKPAYLVVNFASIGGIHVDIETRLQQVATVINQIDDPKVPRNIRRQAKEACDHAEEARGLESYLPGIAR